MILCSILSLVLTSTHIFIIAERDRGLSEACLFIPKGRSSTASYNYRTRYYSEASSCGTGEGALPSAGRTQLMTPCGSIVKAKGCNAPGH
jgi:hypothetical protein